MNRIFLPIEIKAREFHSKLLFALFGAERGYETLLGGQADLIRRMPRLGPGLYIDKSTAITKRDWFDRLREMGNYVAAWDEEGLVYLNDEVYHATRMHEDSFSMTDLFFAWGPHHVRTVLARYPEAADRVVPVGNPRMDLLRREFRGYCDDRVEALRRQYGRMILLNTNFPLHNYAKGPEAAARIFDAYPLKQQKNLLQGWYVFQRQGYDKFRQAALAIHDRFPRHTIVVRPAPSEDEAPWRHLLDGKPRVVVSKEGNVVEWIRAADVVIQFNCTTGVEAFLLDVPSIAYRCVPSDLYETPLPIACSVEAFTQEELLVAVESAVNSAGLPQERILQNREVIKDFLGSLQGRTCCERVLDEIARRRFPARSRTIPRVPAIKRLWRLWLGVVRRPDPKGVRYNRMKFSSLTVAEVRSVAQSFARAANRFHGVRITAAGPNLVRVGPA